MNKPEEYKEKEGQASSELTSLDYLLGPEDVKKFLPERSKDEILKDVQWRGNFEMATQYQGSDVAAISFGLFGGPFGDDARGTILWAIFVDDKFQKFVQWPEWSDKPEKLGAFTALIRAVESEPVNISNLEKEVKPAPTPSQIDPGLTIVFLVLGPAIEAARKGQIKKNAELRNQYNASRLKLGMTEKEVESVLKAKPIEWGEIGTGTWKIYGSKESFDAREYIHYSNLLVLFKSGELSGIYSSSMVPARGNGHRWLREAVLVDGKRRRPLFADLPPSKTPVE